MAVKYLKKRKLYERAKLLIKKPLPSCKEFNYRFYRGCEAEVPQLVEGRT